MITIETQTEESIIKRLKLKQEDVLHIVLEWYLCQCVETFQDKNGFDLEEHLEIEIYNQ